MSPAAAAAAAAGASTPDAAAAAAVAEGALAGAGGLYGDEQRTVSLYQRCRCVGRISPLPADWLDAPPAKGPIGAMC